ncbi:AtpZ/AtpI family protein [Urechidicola croceus]|uniref:F0F1-ATPase subunit n=1 Tax=Urechidicola croceus TaxID=1850246 RepID=A0A1D8P913_9FLAO|nr:AtpZ/AtpI family protein [Urechidicola croceus]AOW21054.1 hypothetical protein LPB138_10340 [Urechidicola croceus]
MKEPKQKKPLNKYIRLTGVGLQMGLTIYLAAYFGKKLDLKYPNERNWFTMSFTVVGVFVALWSVINQVNKINK